MAAGLLRESGAVAGGAFGYGRVGVEGARHEFGPQRGIAGDATGRQHHSPAAGDGECSVGRSHFGAGDAAVLGEERLGLRGGQHRHAALQQRMVEAPDQGIAHDEACATRKAHAVQAVAGYEAGRVQQGPRRFRRVEQMPDVGAVDHHAAEQGELGQRRAQAGEVLAEHDGIERHWLQNATRQRGAGQRGEVVGMIGVGPEGDLAVVFQERDHVGTGVEVGVHQRLADAIAQRRAQIEQGLVGVVLAGGAVARVRHPHRAGRAGAGAADELGLLDQHDVEAEDGGGERRRHAAGAAAEDDEVDFARRQAHCGQLIADCADPPCVPRARRRRSARHHAPPAHRGRRHPASG